MGAAAGHHKNGVGAVAGRWARGGLAMMAVDMLGRERGRGERYGED